ncbi:MAG TPA: hypothetical protein VLW52_15715 [Opitutaceae bacterium]|nr:hypothetical protein [Opitutaceae bacterium]
MTVILFGVVVVVFSGIGYRTYQKLKAGAAKPAPQPAAVAKTPPTATKPAPPPVPGAPTTPEGRAIQKARDVVAAVAANRTGPTNEVTGSAPRSAATASTTPGATTAPSATPAAPGAEAPAAVVQPNQRFRVFVDRLKIGGIRVGPPARLFLGGVTYKPGDVIDEGLGIVFVSVDVSTQEILFKDGTGAVVRRRY